MLRAKNDEIAVRRVQRIIEGVLRHVVGANDPEYDDLVQSCLENVLVAMRAGTFRGDCPLDRWAATIARNIAIDSLRARSRDRRVFSHDGSDDFLDDRAVVVEGADHLAEVRQDLLDIEGILLELGPAKATVVYLHDVLGYEINEISALIGTSLAAAQKRLVRGRREIVNRLYGKHRLINGTPLYGGTELIRSAVNVRNETKKNREMTGAKRGVRSSRLRRT